MLRYKFRTLLIVLALGPPMLFVLSLVWIVVMVHLTSYPPRVKVYHDPDAKTGIRDMHERMQAKRPLS